MKMTVFWNSVPCSVIESDQCFRGAYCLHQQDFQSEQLVLWLKFRFCFSEMQNVMATPAFSLCSIHFVSSQPIYIRLLYLIMKWILDSPVFQEDCFIDRFCVLIEDSHLSLPVRFL
jgi:hypothetical protein